VDSLTKYYCSTTCTWLLFFKKNWVLIELVKVTEISKAMLNQ
jgi:hypothetical protein